MMGESRRACARAQGKPKPRKGEICLLRLLHRVAEPSVSLYQVVNSMPPDTSHTSTTSYTDNLSSPPQASTTTCLTIAIPPTFLVAFLRSQNPTPVSTIPTTLGPQVPSRSLENRMLVFPSYPTRDHERMLTKISCEIDLVPPRWLNLPVSANTPFAIS